MQKLDLNPWGLSNLKNCGVLWNKKPWIVGSRNVRPQSHLKLIYGNADDLNHKDILLQWWSLRHMQVSIDFCELCVLCRGCKAGISHHNICQAAGEPEPAYRNTPNFKSPPEIIGLYISKSPPTSPSFPEWQSTTFFRNKGTSSSCTIHWCSDGINTMPHLLSLHLLLKVLRWCFPGCIESLNCLS